MKSVRVKPSSQSSPSTAQGPSPYDGAANNGTREMMTGRIRDEGIALLSRLRREIKHRLHIHVADFLRHMA